MYYSTTSYANLYSKRAEFLKTGRLSNQHLVKTEHNPTIFDFFSKISALQQVHWMNRRAY